MKSWIIESSIRHMILRLVVISVVRIPIAQCANTIGGPNSVMSTHMRVRTCEPCKRVKLSAHAAAPLATLPVPTNCWELNSMDVWILC